MNHLKKGIVGLAVGAAIASNHRDRYYDRGYYADYPAYQAYPAYPAPVYPAYPVYPRSYYYAPPPPPPVVVYRGGWGRYGGWHHGYRRGW